MEHKDIWLVIGLTVILAVTVSLSTVNLTGMPILERSSICSKFSMEVGDSVDTGAMPSNPFITLGKKVTVIAIGTGSVRIDVDGVSDTFFVGNTKTLNGVSVTLNTISPATNSGKSSVYLNICSSSSQTGVTKANVNVCGSTNNCVKDMLNKATIGKMTLFNVDSAHSVSCDDICAKAGNYKCVLAEATWGYSVRIANNQNVSTVLSAFEMEECSQKMFNRVQDNGAAINMQCQCI